MQMKIAFILFLLVLAVAGPERARAQTLDTTTFVAMGEGLAAGMANYGLSSVVQSKDFAALLAAQMGTGMEQPLIQPPGIGDVVGYPGQEVMVQRYPQGSVRQFYYPTDLTKAPIQTPAIFVNNVSVPGLTLNDAVTMVPVAPVAQRGNMKQTVFNMILGFPQLILDNIPLWTQQQYAQELFPTVAMIELGYYEALTAAVAGNPALMPNPTTFGTTYGTVIAGLRALQTQVIVTTIPNPIDTGYVNSVNAAAAILNVIPSILSVNLGVGPQDYVTRNGLQEDRQPLRSPPYGANPGLGSATAVARRFDFERRDGHRTDQRRQCAERSDYQHCQSQWRSGVRSECVSAQDQGFRRHYFGRSARHWDGHGRLYGRVLLAGWYLSGCYGTCSHS